MKKMILSWILQGLIGMTYSQNMMVTGTIKDKSGEPIVGATVVVKGSNPLIGTATDINGIFVIAVSDSTTELEVKMMSYRTKKVKVKNLKVMNIVLETESQELQTVVHIGYDSMFEGDRTGSVASASFDKALQGRAPNVRITSSSGNPGSGPSMKIRGLSTISSSTGPIYLNPSTETYATINENDFKDAKNNSLSTFSIDVDKASYTNIRRMLNYGQTPPADAVRIEEMVNYFEYNYPQPESDHPIAIYTELASCPWNSKHKILHIGLKGKNIDQRNLPASNLVFLIDVSGSMAESNKLPLLKQAFKLLVANLREEDMVSIVTYAGNAGLALKPTKGSNKTKINEAIDALESGGSTAGGEGIQLAYSTAKENFVKGGNNRVILATDGDFNVGVSNENELEDLIVKQRETGIFLTCLGVGMGNYKDSKIEILADKGNGNYAYIDNIQEARKVLVSEFGGTLFTIAKDVKAQIEFNPQKVKAYRLVGYENRLLNNEDFKDDKKDAGEMGSGHTVTIMYEIIPVGVKSNFTNEIDSLKYQSHALINNAETDLEIATVKIRYKKPDGDKSIEMVQPIADSKTECIAASENFRYAASVAMFGMILSESKYKNDIKYKDVIELAENAKGVDKDGYRSEFIRLVKAIN